MQWLSIAHPKIDVENWAQEHDSLGMPLKAQESTALSEWPEDTPKLSSVILEDN